MTSENSLKTLFYASLIRIEERGLRPNELLRLLGTDLEESISVQEKNWLNQSKVCLNNFLYSVDSVRMTVKFRGQLVLNDEEFICSMNTYELCE